jgi:hypothetical protein
MCSLVVCDGDPFDRYSQVAGRCGPVPAAGWSGDDYLDIGKPARGLAQAAACHLGAGSCEL